MHSLIANDVGHHFMYLATGISSLEKSVPLFPVFIEFSFCYSLERVLDTFWTLDPCEILDLPPPLSILYFGRKLQCRSYT